MQEVLAGYQGTILLVSHDRYLIDALATQVWEIDERAGRLFVFKGTYSEYRSFQEARREEQRIRLEAQRRQVEVGKPSSAKMPAAKRTTAGLTNADRRRLARLGEVEVAIARLESQLEELSRKLENPPSDPLKVQRLGNEYIHLQKELDRLLLEWEELYAEVQAIS